MKTLQQARSSPRIRAQWEGVESFPGARSHGLALGTYHSQQKLRKHTYDGSLHRKTLSLDQGDLVYPESNNVLKEDL